MKRIAILLACAAFVACSSSTNGGSNTGGAAEKATLNAPEIQLVQLVGPADQNFPPGQIQVQYGIRVANRSGEPLTFKRLDLESLGGGGPYRLRKQTYYFDKTVAPDQYQDLDFWAYATSTGNWRSVDAYAPVAIRGVAHFESPAGPVRKIFLKTLAQDRGRGIRD